MHHSAGSLFQCIVDRVLVWGKEADVQQKLGASVSPVLVLWMNLAIRLDPVTALMCVAARGLTWSTGLVRMMTNAIGLICISLDQDRYGLGIVVENVPNRLASFCGMAGIGSPQLDQG